VNLSDVSIARKSTVCGPSQGAAAAHVAAALAIPHAQQGIVIAGSPAGSPIFVRDFGVQRSKQVTRAVTTLMALPLELQNKFLLLCLSMVPRLTYLLCVGPLDPSQGCMDEEVQTATRAIQEAGGELFGPSCHEQPKPSWAYPYALGDVAYPYCRTLSLAGPASCPQP
jgi:hypothetical protein